VNKTLLIIILFVLSASPVIADSDGYYTTGSGVVVYEEWLKYPDRIFVIFFGNDIGISDPAEIILPRKIEMNVQSLQVKEDTITVVLRDIVRKRKQGSVFEISNDNLESYVYDIKNHKSPKLIHQFVKPYERMNAPPPLKENLGAWSRKGIISLSSNDKEHSYQMVLDVQQMDKNKISEESGIIYWEHTTNIIQKNRSGMVTLKKEIFRGIFEESID